MYILSLTLMPAVILRHECLTEMSSLCFHGGFAGKEGGEKMGDEKRIANIVCKLVQVIWKRAQVNVSGVRRRDGT